MTEQRYAAIRSVFSEIRYSVREGVFLHIRYVFDTPIFFPIRCTLLPRPGAGLWVGPMDEGMDKRMDGWTDGIPPHSTGLPFLLGPLPKKLILQNITAYQQHKTIVL